MNDLIELTEDEWFEQFKPIPNPYDENASFQNEEGEGSMFETFGSELVFVRTSPLNTIWTYGDGDNGGTYIWSGYRIVNRIGYFVTTVPFDETKDYQITISERDE